MIGAFQGAMPSMTPTGSRRAMAMQPGLSEGMTSPPIWVVMAAASRRMPVASIRLKPAQAWVAPVSPIMASMNWGARAAMASAALLSRARRALGPSADQAGKAAAAASAAAMASAALPAVAVVTAWPVTGSRRSNVAVDACASPPTRMEIWVAICFLRYCYDA